jgi:hypothetical protein
LYKNLKLLFGPWYYIIFSLLKSVFYGPYRITCFIWSAHAMDKSAVLNVFIVYLCDLIHIDSPKHVSRTLKRWVGGQTYLFVTYMCHFDRVWKNNEKTIKSYCYIRHISDTLNFSHITNQIDTIVSKPLFLGNWSLVKNNVFT